MRGIRTGCAVGGGKQLGREDVHDAEGRVDQPFQHHVPWKHMDILQPRGIFRGGGA